MSSDAAFEMFLATILPSDLTEWEYSLFTWHRLHRG